MSVQIILKCNIPMVDQNRRWLPLVTKVLSETPYWSLDCDLILYGYHELEMTFDNLSVDRDARRLFINFIKIRLAIFNLPFSLMDTNFEHSDNKIFFTRKHLYPRPSDNALLLQEEGDGYIPPKFICSISGDIMDHPVYDIRFPNYRYDIKIFRLLQKEPGDQWEEDFMKTDDILQKQINEFMLQKIFKKFSIPDNELFIGDKKNKAFRRAVIAGNFLDLKFLVRTGANIDSTNQEGRTALQLALHHKKIQNVIFLLNLNPNLNKPDIYNQTFWTMCERIPLTFLKPIVEQLHFLNILVPPKIEDRLRNVPSSFFSSPLEHTHAPIPMKEAPIPSILNG